MININNSTDDNILQPRHLQYIGKDIKLNKQQQRQITIIRKMASAVEGEVTTELLAIEESWGASDCSIASQALTEGLGQVGNEAVEAPRLLRLGCQALGPLEPGALEALHLLALAPVFEVEDHL